ncbi:hypothetical protein HMPREF1864_01359 [Peptoniphilus sp. DNF00840]|nr:hypothetical protein HMPREF1864_01359 [Peptoniphilus sp. DNF00840]
MFVKHGINSYLYYEDFFFKTILKAYTFNKFLKPKSLLKKFLKKISLTPLPYFK